METYYEQSVANLNIDKQKKLTTLLTIIRHVILAVVIIFCFIYIMMMKLDGVLSVIISIGFMLVVISPFVCAIILIAKKLSRTNVEYDYHLVGSVLRIIKVMNRTKRKMLMKISISQIESVGPISSDAYDRYAANRYKKVMALCSYEDESKIYYIYHNGESKVLLLWEPDEQMISALRRGLPRMSIMENVKTK